MTKAILEQALEALEDCDTAIKHLMQPAHPEVQITKTSATDVMKAIRAHLAQLQGEQAELDRSDLYQNQMAGIMTAALGYWKEGDSVHPSYLTAAMRDVASLYAKYDALYQEKYARPPGEPVAWINPAGTYAEASTSSTVYGSHTIPLYIHPTYTEGPAWHDAPNAPGLWVVGSRCLHINELDLPIYKDSHCRWYGPIPADDGGKP